MKTREFPLPLPTARAAWMLAAAAVPVALGAVEPGFAWAGLALAAAVIVAIVADWMTLPRARDLRVERAERRVLSLGDDESLDVAVELVSGSPVTARAVDDLPAALECAAAPAPLLVRTGEPARFSTRVRARRRGEFALSAFHLRYAGAFGLAERQVRFDVPVKVRVYPGIRAVARSGRHLRPGRTEQLGRRRVRRRGEGTSFESMREYVRGEDPRHIDWKASARHAKLIARHYEVERNQNVMLLVDCGRWMTGESGGLTRLDRVLDACVLLAHSAAAREDRVGVLAFADEVLAYVPPVKGRAAAQAIVEATFRIEPRLVESDYAGAFAYLAARQRKRSLVVLFTDVLSRDASRSVVEECARSARRHLPLAVALRDTDLDDLARAVPGNAAAAYRQAAAEELLLEREEALAVMRRAGVQVLDAPAKSLGPAVVERYLELKSRMLV